MTSIPDPKKILIIRLSSMGDILLTTPLIRVLRKRFPSSKIDFVIKSQFEELLISNPHLNKIYVYDPKTGFKGLRQLRIRLLEEKYHLIVDLHKNFRSIYLRIFYPGAKVVKIQKRSIVRFLLVHFKWHLYKKILSVPEKYFGCLKDYGLKDDAAGLEYPILPGIRARMEKLFNNHGLQDNDFLIAMAPGAGRCTKRWPYPSFAQLGNLLAQVLNAKIVLFGGEQDRRICQQISDLINGKCVDLCGRLSLMKTAAAMDKCHLLITNDTGLVHMASALKKKVVAIYGPTTEEFGFFPYTTEHIVIQRHLPCRPCSYHGSDSCKKGHFKCMKDISATEVLQAVRKLLNKEPKVDALTPLS